jgi:glycosyltransferase involved in cell wall biosynthesis
MPTAIESLDLSEFDKVLSSSAIFSKGLVLKPSTKHICYCYSPTRFLWDRNRNFQLSFFNFQWLKEIFKHFFRLWDRSAADRVDQFVAISKIVQSRISKYYRRDSLLVYPPVGDLNRASSNTKPTVAGGQPRAERKSQQTFNAGRRVLDERDFYLIVSRLYPYKNIDIAIEAFNKLGYPLVIIGDGPDRKRLERMAGDKVTFLGERSDSTLAEYYRSCRAFIMPQEEDFGLTPIEAMSFGKPVVALRRGGAIETIIEGQTGEFFDDPIPEALADAIRRLNDNYSRYNPETIKKQASLFSAERFEKEIRKLVD